MGRLSLAPALFKHQRDRGGGKDLVDGGGRPGPGATLAVATRAAARRE
jgi:hypothetical protein